MKKWIHATTDHPADSAIESMVYEANENYKGDSRLTYDDVLAIVIEHLENPDIYSLKEGQDFSAKDVAGEMTDYDWYLEKEEQAGRSVMGWYLDKF